MKPDFFKTMVALGLIFLVYFCIYIYESLQIKNLNKLVAELDMINKHQVEDFNKYYEKMAILASELISVNISKKEIVNVYNTLQLELKAYNKEMKYLKTNLKTDKAIEYMDNFIARQKIKIEPIMIMAHSMKEFAEKDGLSGKELYDAVYQKINDEVEILNKKNDILEIEKTNMEAELSKLLHQQILLN